MKLIRQTIPFFMMFLLMLFTVSPIQAFADTDDESQSYVALGDSLAAGVLNETVPPNYALGKGYPVFIQEGMELVLGSEVRLTNAGFPGFTSENVLDQLKNNTNNIMDALAEADIVTLDAGANDLLQTVDIENIDPGDPESLQKAVQDATKAIGQISTNMTAILDEVNSVNPDAAVYVMGYYNAKPYLEDMQDMIIMVMGIMNDAIEDATNNGGAIYVPTFDAFVGNYKAYLPNPNNIHPNEAGYEVIANLFLEKIQPVDSLKPEITLTGDNPMELEVGEAYDEPGATAEDNVDGNLTEAIEISGEVNIGEPGEYIVTYTVADAAGNETVVTRTVNVKEVEVEEPSEETGGLWFVGEDDPDSDIGEKGDFYLNTTLFDVYQKDAEAWKLIGNLKADDGQDGMDESTWSTGEGSPAAEDGEAGDLYVDKASHDVYFKNAEGWSVVANLEDPAESPEPEDPNGNEGDKNEPGTTGDCDCEMDDSNTDSVDTKIDGVTTDDSNDEGGELPDTATNNPLFILIGTLMLVVGGAIVFIRKKVIRRDNMQIVGEPDC